MKDIVKVLVCCVFIALGSRQASAEPGPPVDLSQTCEVQVQTCTATLGETRTALATCEQDAAKAYTHIQKYCPRFADVPYDAFREQVRTGAPPPRKPRTRRPPKAPKPSAPATPPRAAILVIVGEHELIEPGEICTNGGYVLPIGFDLNGNKELDADEVKDKLPACKGDKGDPGEPGKPGASGASVLTKSERFAPNSECSNGGTRTTMWTDLDHDGKREKGELDAGYVCDGKSGSAGRPGANGNTRVQFGLGMRTSAILSKDRPLGYSVAPEAQLELWLAPTVEFVTGIAWAPDGDRNMVVTGQLRRRALGKRLGLGIGVQYQAWNLEGNKALWQSVMGMGSVQAVLIDGKWVDVSVDAGLLLGVDGYDDEAQFAGGVTGGLTISLKL